ncbi:MAG TPA: Asp-tRNA(Asn)/Glu-tRNA(Gln) amidotransferase subunit GatC [Ktedonobacterales bacterium]|jgi:aspartyl-tRNA(Asn)/glutamyl-tRNA(Gln) amidotransferase subunit C
MSIDRATVEHTARLARLALSEPEIERLAAQLSAILEHIAVLREADTSQVPPTVSAQALQNVLDADVARPCDTPDELLANAPAREGDYIRVRAVLDE